MAAFFLWPSDIVVDTAEGKQRCSLPPGLEQEAQENPHEYNKKKEAPAKKLSIFPKGSIGRRVLRTRKILRTFPTDNAGQTQQGKDNTKSVGFGSADVDLSSGDESSDTESSDTDWEQFGEVIWRANTTKTARLQMRKHDQFLHIELMPDQDVREHYPSPYLSIINWQPSPHLNKTKCVVVVEFEGQQKVWNCVLQQRTSYWRLLCTSSK